MYQAILWYDWRRTPRWQSQRVRLVTITEASFPVRLHSFFRFRLPALLDRICTLSFALDPAVTYYFSIYSHVCTSYPESALCFSDIRARPARRSFVPRVTYSLVPRRPLRFGNRGPFGP